MYIFHFRGKATVAKILFFSISPQSLYLDKDLENVLVNFLFNLYSIINWSKCFLLVFLFVCFRGGLFLESFQIFLNFFFFLSFCSNLGVLLHIFWGHDSLVHLSAHPKFVAGPHICSFIISSVAPSITPSFLQNFFPPECPLGDPQPQVQSGLVHLSNYQCTRIPFHSSPRVSSLLNLTFSFLFCWCTFLN